MTNFITKIVVKVMYVAGEYYKNIIEYLKGRRKRGVLKGRIYITSTLSGNLTPMGRQDISGTISGTVNTTASMSLVHTGGGGSSANLLPLNYANGFETGTPSDYTQDGTFTITADSGNKYSGNYAIKLVGSNTNWITSSPVTVATTPGTTWSGSCQGKTDSSNGYLCLHWWDSGKNYLTENTTAFAGASYTKYGVIANAPANTAYVTLGFRGGPVSNTSYVDEIQLEQATTPTAYIAPGGEGSTTIYDVIAVPITSTSTIAGNLTVESGKFIGNIAAQSNITGTLSKQTGESKNLLTLNLSNGFESGSVTDIKTIGTGSSSVNLLPINVANGGDNGTVNEWQTYEGGPAVTITPDNVNKYSGAYGITATEVSGKPWIRTNNNNLVAVTPGVNYVLSFYGKNEWTYPLYIAIMWYDSNKTFISYTNNGPSVDTTYTRIEVTGAAPANAAYAAVFAGADNPTIHIDNIQFEVGTTATAWVAPGSSSGVAVSADSANKYSGNYCMKVVGNTTNYITTVGSGLSNIPVTVGNKYTVQARIKSNDVMGKFGIVWTDAGFNILSSTTTTLGGTSYASVTSITGTAPASAVYGGLFIQPSPTNPATETMYLDELQFEAGDAATAWAPGGSSGGTNVPLNGNISSTSNIGASLTSTGVTPPPPTGGILDMRLDYANVKDYGATGNGVTNDTNAIMSAYNAGNGRIYFPAGTYICNLNITINANGTGHKIPYILGESPNTVTLKAANSNPVIQFNNAYWIACAEFRNFCIDGNNTSNGLELNNTGSYVIYNPNVRNLYIKNVKTALLYSGIVETALTENITVVGAETGINAAGVYNTFSNINLNQITNYGIYCYGGQSTLWRQINTDGVIYNFMSSSRFESCCIHDIYAANPPSGAYATSRTAFQDIGNTTIVDVTLKDVNSVHAGAITYGYCAAASQVDHVIERFVIAGSTNPAYHPTYPMLFDSLTDATIIHVDGGSSTNNYAEKYLNSSSLSGCRISGGGPFFKNWTKREAFGTAAPTSGDWSVGDKVWHTNPGSGGNIGWICTAAGTPGTWKGFGSIA